MAPLIGTLGQARLSALMTEGGKGCAVLHEMWTSDRVGNEILPRLRSALNRCGRAGRQRTGGNRSVGYRS